MDSYKKSEPSLHILYLMPLSLKVYIMLQNEKKIIFLYIWATFHYSCIFNTGQHRFKKKINEVFLEVYLYMLSFILNTLYK